MKNRQGEEKGSTHLEREKARYWDRRREKRCVTCGREDERTRAGNCMCESCAGKSRERALDLYYEARLYRTCLGPCGRTLSFDVRETTPIIHHHCKACGRETGWLKVEKEEKEAA